MRPRVLELGNYIVPAYAGMILAEQGCEVTKWVKADNDPILKLDRGDELWSWINHGKRVIDRPLDDLRDALSSPRFEWDIVIDNLREKTLSRYLPAPDELADAQLYAHVSMRADVGERSFDVIAQARSWMEYAPWVPLYVGDTTGGLWLAFKALAMHAQSRWGHHVLYQASLMQKLVEGELVVPQPTRDGRIPWDRDLYMADNTGAHVEYKGETLHEPVRGAEWKLRNLHHDGGRMRV